MRNQYKVLSEKYELQVEVPTTREERAIYNTRALTKDFLPTAIKIYRDQVEPVIRSWPDFDIMTDIKFPHNILINASNYSGAAIIVPAGWSDMYLYKSQNFPYGNVDAILERWFVHYLYGKLYTGFHSERPKSFYKKVQRGLIPPLKSNADFIQYLIKLTVTKMKSLYDVNHKKAVSSGDLADWKAAQELNQKNAQATGGDWDPQGLMERYDIVREDDSVQQDLDEVVEQIVDRARLATQGYIKLLNNRKIPGIKLGEYIKQNINPIIQEIMSHVTDKNPYKKAQLENYLKELLTTTWLTVDRVYWDVEMDTIVRGAVEDGEAIIQDLDKMADRGNKIINK